MSDAADLVSQQNLRVCRYCGELFGPIYGAVKRHRSGGGVSGVRAMVDDLAGDESGTYFECYGCEAKNRRKKHIFYATLAALLVGALLYKAFSSD